MKGILDDPIIKKVFKVKPGIDGVDRLVCMGCQVQNKNFSAREGFKLNRDPLYSAAEGGHKQNIARWFLNLKGNLVKHIESDSHKSASRALLQESSINIKVRDESIIGWTDEALVILCP